MGNLLSADDVGAPRRRCDNRPTVYRAWQAWRAGTLAATVREINAISSTERLNAVSLDYLAAILISLGRVDEARPLLDRSVRLDPTSPRAPALRAIVEVARNQPQQAAQSADAAVTLAPASPAARIAQSYALQSGLRLEEARSALLAATPPDDPLVQARLAEVEFYLGNIGAARSAAERAIAAAPALSRPRSILGFVDLAAIPLCSSRGCVPRCSDARPRGSASAPRARAHRHSSWSTWRKGRRSSRSLSLSILPAQSSAAISAKPMLPTGAMIQPSVNGDWPSRLDPKDPTPWLYQALANRSLNRPGDALADVQKSIELNDNRAVYRSRLLLDQDLATRGADLAGIYRDLGFDQAALVQGYKSVNTDPSNPSAHRFLSETFLGLPRHETASDSELLQSLLLQPLNINPPPPRLSRQAIGILPSLNRPGSVTTNSLRCSPAMGLAF